MLTMAPAATVAAAAADEPTHTVQPRINGPGGYMMPAHFGPLARPAPGEFKPSGPGDAPYGDVQSIFLSYLTDVEMLSRYLPIPFELTGEPVVNVSYSMNRSIDWLAGGSYNIIGVNVPATYKGVEKVSGSYPLVLWENLTDPILTGREAQGIPKIYGDIEDHQVSGDSWRTSLSRNGHKILDLRASSMKPVAPAALENLKKLFSHGVMLGWKYIPNENFSGAALSYATAFPTGSSLREAWNAEGGLEWHRQTWSQNPTQSHIVNAMQSLPIKEIRACLVTKGSVVLHSSKVRRLT